MSQLQWLKYTWSRWLWMQPTGWPGLARKKRRKRCHPDVQSRSMTMRHLGMGQNYSNLGTKNNQMVSVIRIDHLVGGSALFRFFWDGSQGRRGCQDGRTCQPPNALSTVTDFGEKTLWSFRSVASGCIRLNVCTLYAFTVCRNLCLVLPECF